MKRLMLSLALLAAQAPHAAVAGEPASPLPAGVDRDVFCQMLTVDLADRAEHVPEDRKAAVAGMLESTHRAVSFYAGSATARLSDAQISAAAKAADHALAGTNKDDMAVYVQYCLNDMTQRTARYAERVLAN